MRILVAEDQKDMNRLISKRLTAENYSVDSCFSREIEEFHRELRARPVNGKMDCAGSRRGDHSDRHARNGKCV